jgi:hypothetical protein
MFAIFLTVKGALVCHWPLGGFGCITVHCVLQQCGGDVSSGVLQHAVFALGTRFAPTKCSEHATDQGRVVGFGNHGGG